MSTSIEKLKSFLSDPAQKGRVISLLEASQAAGCANESEFMESVGIWALAEIWLEVNPEAKPFLKTFYQQMAANAEKLAQQTYPEESTPSESITDGIMEMIQKEYVQAPRGDFPTFRKVLDRLKGQEQFKAKAFPTEQQVTKQAAQEDWRGQRDAYLQENFEMTASELDMVSLEHLLEYDRMLMNQAKLTNNALVQYFKTGQVLALEAVEDDDGERRTKVLQFAPTFEDLRESGKIHKDLIVESLKIKDRMARYFKKKTPASGTN